MTQQIKTIRLRCYPSIEQKDMFNIMFGHNRFVYNYMLHLQQFCYKHANDTSNYFSYLSNFDMHKLLTCLKRKQRYSWLKQCESTSLQQTCNHLDLAYQRFFNKLGGFPKFKKRSHRQSYTSLCVNHNINQLQNNILRLPKVGAILIQPYKLKGTIKRITLVMTPRGHYFINVVIQRGIKQLPKTRKSIGIDLGLRNIANLSNGVKYKSLRFKQLDKQIVIAQRKLSRRIINAKKQEQMDIQNKHKFNLFAYTDEQSFRNLPWYERRGVVEARQRLAKLYDKKTNYRKDYLQKLSTRLIKQYDVIVFEKIRPSNMLKNHKLAKALSSQGWRMFIRMCQYKAKWYGKTIIEVSPRNTTQTCFTCGYILQNDEKLTLNIERWQCPNCGRTHDRDINAAKNILTLGLQTI